MHIWCLIETVRMYFIYIDVNTFNIDRCYIISIDSNTVGVFGETYLRRVELAKLGGKYMKFLRDPSRGAHSYPGWQFPVSQRQNLEILLATPVSASMDNHDKGFTTSDDLIPSSSSKQSSTINISSNNSNNIPNMSSTNSNNIPNISSTNSIPFSTSDVKSRKEKPLFSDATTAAIAASPVIIFKFEVKVHFNFKIPIVCCFTGNNIQIRIES